MGLVSPIILTLVISPPMWFLTGSARATPLWPLRSGGCAVVRRLVIAAAGVHPVILGALAALIALPVGWCAGIVRTMRPMVQLAVLLIQVAEHAV